MLIAQMIARNEEGRFLEQVLNRLAKQVDLIVFTDDYSTDKTKDIATSYGAATFQTLKPMFVENEGALRQLAWDNMAKFATEGDWILSIDADEEFFPGPNFEALLNQNRYKALGVTFYHMWNETHYRIDKAWRPNVSSRLFQFQPNGIFKQRKLACGSEPTYVQQWIRERKFLTNSGIRMKHLGYMLDEDKQAKFERYMELDHGDFHSLQHIESIMDEQIVLKRWED